ncbi:DEAD_2 domain-containing protein [Gaeumannomyces tritici R3-111a-1]|uniref:ATP-dependent DNA helicase CHL1 n=1 Tax=Gaeumannomyces tritici (strain R3-111a-1) TaxID=644352 RepID=J3NX16_GAET3|nr:DEAD_2 domain-containing protein [Gaeumannomyces tritici R3-111a-1]EJT75898.1 DEAD_2 domain-containing protein [Gaeumannomyces tritici R3-111a-1]
MEVGTMMLESGSDEATAVDFNHPFTPYDVQLEFMSTVYSVLQQGDGQVAVLESPTGTGKSLSLICACMTWLRRHKRARFDLSLGDAATQLKDEPDWVVEQVLRRKRDELAQRWQERERRLQQIREKEKLDEQRAAKRRRMLDDDRPLPRHKGRAGDEDDEEDDEFLLDWDRGQDSADPEAAKSWLSKETRDLLEKAGMGPSRTGIEEDELAEEEVKIFYTSRTHSQLSQFISELRRPNFPPSFPNPSAGADQGQADGSQAECVKHIPLSSRQRLCINPAVARLGSVSAINDRCAELQTPKSGSKGNKCPFVPNQENLGETHEFRDTALATLPDIEDAHRLGKSLRVCPYYATRTAIPGAEIITLPYPLLLQRSAREAFGIDLKGSVVVIDEAHNIMDAVAGVHAAEVRLGDLRRAREMLSVYAKRFGKKLKGENRIMVGQVARAVQGLSEWLERTLEARTEQGIVDPRVLLKTKGMDQMDMFALVGYIQESKLAFKIESYATRLDEKKAEAAGKQATTRSSPVLHSLSGFLLALTNLSSEGRIFFERLPPASPADKADIKLSYLLLSPTHAFSSIASSARAIVLAGGTMSPFQDYETHLFPMHPPAKITTLSCGHVIPPSNLCVWTLSSMRPGPAAAKGTGNDVFDFSFQKRRDKNMIQQLGTAILNTCSVVPDGVVVFFPSYGYLDEVIASWKERPSGPTGPPPIWDRLQAKKAVFRESKGGSSEEVLQNYTSAILGGAEDAKASAKKTEPNNTAQSGALLLSVVGGKMSEGINFSDRLGRCVVIVGLPYPNIASPEWKARMEYIESSTVDRLLGKQQQQQQQQQSTQAAGMTREQAAAAGKQAAREFYENACMRAVNQSIGRAIRHRGDYAAIVLLDSRFGADRIRGKLPGWIRGGMPAPGGAEERRAREGGLPGLMGALSKFFREKRVTEPLS